MISGVLQSWAREPWEGSHDFVHGRFIFWLERPFQKDEKCLSKAPVEKSRRQLKGVRLIGTNPVVVSERTQPCDLTTRPGLQGSSCYQMEALDLEVVSTIKQIKQMLPSDALLSALSPSFSFLETEAGPTALGREGPSNAWMDEADFPPMVITAVAFPIIVCDS